MGGSEAARERIEAHAALILQEIERTPDITLGELKVTMAAAGVTAGIATLWRFLDRHGITLKKSRRMLPSRTAPMS